MHLNTKNIALGGVLMAIAVLCIVLGSIFQFNTLVLLLIAAFLSGAVINDCGLGVGAMFITGTFILGFSLAPEKLHALTYLCFAIYIFLVETIYRFRQRATNKGVEGSNAGWNAFIWLCKFIIFNTIFLFCLLMMPEVILGTSLLEKGGIVIGIAAIAGQFVWIILDMAYNTFINRYWIPFRKRIK